MIDVLQGSEEWIQARLGQITASRISDVMAGGKGITRFKYMCQLAAERISGISASNGLTTQAMKRGTELEPDARDLYSIQYGVEVEEVGYIKHPTISNAMASPDGLIDDDGLIEIKCPDLSTYIDYWINRKIPTDYQLQMLFQMACTGRSYCDFVAYTPDLPTRIRLLVIRFERDDNRIAEIEESVIRFDCEVDNILNLFKDKLKVPT